MKRSLKANMLTNFRFYQRNRLLIVASLLFLAIMLLTMIPSVIFTSANERFHIVMQIYSMLSGFLAVVIGLIALLSISSHRMNKSITMVFTKPCPPEEWVFSQYLSAATLFLAGISIAVFLFVVLCLAWGIPIQGAVIASVLNNFAQTMMIFAYLFMLTTWMHPLVAGFFFLVISEDIFYWLALVCKAGAESVKSWVRYLLVPLRFIFEWLYYLFPTMSPFNRELNRLDTGLRLGAGDGQYIVGVLVYAFFFISFCYLLTCYSLRKRRLT